MLVYKITNDINDKVYVGQTRRDFDKRVNDYKRDAKYCKGKRLRPIIGAMQKHGFEHFSFSILEDNISDEKQLDERERFYIKKYDCANRGYNVENGGNSVGKHSEATKRKIGEAQKGSKNHMYGKTGELNATSKSVIDLTTGKIYGSAMQAAKDLGLEFSHVCSIARCERASTKEHVFRHVYGEFDEIEVPENHVKFHKLSTYGKILPEYESVL